MLPRRVLLQLAQLPGDPSSGAARSMLTTVEILAADPAHWEVYALGTSACEKPAGMDLAAHFAHLGITPVAGEFSGRRVWRYAYRGVQHTVLDVGNCYPHDWDPLHSGPYDALYQQLLRKQHIDTVVTFGGTRQAHARRRLAKDRGCTVVFGLRNLHYLIPGAFENIDAVFTPSEFLTRRYRDILALQSTPLDVPLDWDDTVASEHQRLFITAINPSAEKGLYFLARLFEELATRRPDIPVLVIESRGTGGQLLAAARAAGFDLARHPSLMLSPGVPKPRDIFALTRVLLVPSVVEEASGRVAAEALANGIPPLVSTRGGLPDTVTTGGLALPLPAWMTPSTTQVPTPAEVAPWLDWIIQLADNEPLYTDWTQKAAAAGQRFHPTRVAEQVLAFFRALPLAPH